jgi:hypothetical protein
MKRALILALALVVPMAPTSSYADVRERASTASDHQTLNLTVYNGGTALIHDRRLVYLDAGLNRIAWRDVSASMEPTSAVLDSLDPSAHVSVLEQNFDYNVLGQDSLLRAYVGRYVTVVHPARFAGERDRRERARILSVDNGVVLQYRDRIETAIDGYIEFPGIPSSLRDRPTLALDIQSDRRGPQQLDLRYLSSGLSWYADYIGTLSSDETRMRLTGLVTLSNSSGAAYQNARLQLVAGAVNVAVAPRAVYNRVMGAESGVPSGVGTPQQENYFEYHLYTMPRRTTILDQQTKQLLLLSADDVPVKKTLELRGSPLYYQGENPDLGDRLPVGVYVSFENRGGNLGIPLPAGLMRIYQSDSHGLSQFLGSDSIQHTPRNDTVRLHLGDSFDIVARKRQTNFALVTNCRSDSSYEITIINGKDVAQDVMVVEPIPGDWTITAESQPHLKSSASTATWTVHAQADGKTTLTYTADVTWCR